MDKLWWTSVPNARKFVDDIVKIIKMEKSVVYTVSKDFPWNNTFSYILSSEIDACDKTVDMIVAANLGAKSPGEYLFETYCKYELKLEYRSSIGYEKFLASNDHLTVLMNKYIYVKGCNSETFKKWVNFVVKYTNYHEKNAPMCCFIIENASGSTNTGNIANICWNDYFHKYDIDMLCLLMSSSLKENELIKKYTAELASSLSYGNVEFAAELVAKGGDLIFDTQQVVDDVVEHKVRSDGMKFCKPESMEHCIREAQMVVFFPVIEKYREQFVEKYREQLERCSYKTTYGKDVENYHEFELGGLKYLYDKGLLCISNKEQCDLIFFRDCRNKLAHMLLLLESDVKKISEYNFKHQIHAQKEVIMV